MSLEKPNALHAAGSVSAAGALVGGAGFAPAKTAKGTYTLTLDQAVDSTEAAIIVTTNGATPQLTSVEHTSDTVKTVHTADDLGADTDGAFNVKIIRFAG